MVNLEHFNPKIERERAGLTQAAMAGIFGVDPSQISRWENDPDGMTRGQLKRWGDACGYFRSPAGLVPGDLYIDLRQSLELVVRHVVAWGEYIDSIDDVPSVEEVVATLRAVPRKPVGALVGMPDSAKSRLANTLYGTDVLPVGFGPATRLLCLCRHVSDRPESMDAAVYILGAGFDLSRASDVDHVRNHQVAAGGLDILATLGTHDYQQQLDRLDALRSDDQSSELKRAVRYRENVIERYAIVYLDTPFLMATDILDSPGVSEDPIDVELAFEAIRRASYLIHCSNAAGYMNNTDLHILQEASRYLPKVVTASGNPFGNIVFVCTHAAPYITETDIDKVKFIGATRLQQHLSKIAPLELAERCAGTHANTAPLQRDAILARTVPFFVESEERRASTFTLVEAMLKEDLPQYVTKGSLRKAGVILGNFKRSYERMAVRTMELINEVGGALREYKEITRKHKDRQSEMNQKKNNLDECIYEMREQAESEVGAVADFYMNYRNIERAIRDTYGDDRTEARIGSAALISGFIQNQVLSILRKKLAIVEAAIQGIAEYHARRVQGDKPDIDLDSPEGIDSNTLRHVTGGIGGAGVGALALMGIVPVMGPVVALSLVIGGIFTALAGMIRSWQEKMARRLAESFAQRNPNLRMILIGISRRYWDEVEKRAQNSVQDMEKQYARRFKSLKALVDSNPLDRQRSMIAQAEAAKRTSAYLERTPIEECSE